MLQPQASGHMDALHHLEGVRDLDLDLDLDIEPRDLEKDLESRW